MNKLFITSAYIGKKGVELKFTQGKGTAVATYSISVPKEFSNGDKKEYDFFNTVTWGKQAEWLANNAHRVKKINISGRLQSRSYENKEGNKVFVVEIVTDHVEVAEWSNDAAETNTGTEGITEIADGEFGVMGELPF